MGGYRTVEDEKDGYSHVVLPREEYEDLCRTLEQTRVYAKNQIEEAQKQANHEIECARWEAAKEVKDIQTALQMEQDKNAAQEKLNAGLKRICRERANAERGVVPKKQHTGFVVLSSSTRLYQCGAGSRREHIWAWETVIQTPYEVDLPAEQVHELLQTDLPQIVAVKLGLSEMDEDSSRNSEENFMLEYRLRANFRSEYWEMSLIHTGPLGTVPAEMRNPLKQKKKRQAEG